MSQETIVNYEDYKPHVNIYTNDGNVHVLPESLIKDWVTGDKEPDAECMRRIIEEWINKLRALRGDGPIIADYV